MSQCLTLDDSWIRQPWTNGLTQVQTPPELGGDDSVRADSALVGTGRREKEFHDRIAAVQSYQSLPTNWDRYGGMPACPEPLEFADKLLHKLAGTDMDVSAPVVRPISGGVYIEWRLGDAILYFEADDESVLQYSKTALGEQTTVDQEFNWERAYEIVKSFYDDAA